MKKKYLRDLIKKKDEKKEVVYYFYKQCFHPSFLMGVPLITNSDLVY